MQVPPLEVFAHDDGITPVGWSLTYNAPANRFELEVIDLWQLDQPTLAISAAPIVATEPTAENILQQLLDHTPFDAPEPRVYFKLSEGLAEWIGSAYAHARNQATP